MIKFIHRSGPHGDATCWYDIKFPDGWTVEDFMRYVVYTYAPEHDEWGEFAIGSTDFVEYTARKGEQPCAWLCVPSWAKDREARLAESRRLYNDNINKKLISVRANGGWSAMSYYLTVESDKPRIQAELDLPFDKEKSNE